MAQAEELGYDFVQTLPLRGFGKDSSRLAKRLTKLPLPIRYCEGAWTHWDSIGQVVNTHLKRRAGLPGYPTILDLLCFPPRNRCVTLEQALSQVKNPDGSLPYLISHSFPPETEDRDEAARQLIEVHRGLGLSVKEIIGRCNKRRQRRCLVIDTNHLRKMDEGMDGGWKRALPKLCPYALAVHVQPLRATPRGQRSELKRCLAGEETELGEMLKMIAYASPEPPFDFTVEATRGFEGVLRPDSIGPTMRDFRRWVEKALTVSQH